MLLRVVSMVTKLGRRNHELREERVVCGDYDYDYDCDTDNEETEEKETEEPGPDLRRGSGAAVNCKSGART